MIPNALRGTRRDVTSKCRRLVSEVIKANDWTYASDAGTASDVFSHGGAIIMKGPLVDEDGDDTTTLLYPLGDRLCAAAARNEYERLEHIQELVLAGMDHFWVSLGAIGSPPRLLPTNRNEVDDRRFAVVALRKLVRWWDVLTRLEPRFLNGYLMPQAWPEWGTQVFCWCREAGMGRPDIERLASISAYDAGARLTTWIGDLKWE